MQRDPRAGAEDVAHSNVETLGGELQRRRGYHCVKLGFSAGATWREERLTFRNHPFNLRTLVVVSSPNTEIGLDILHNNWWSFEDVSVAIMAENLVLRVRDHRRHHGRVAFFRQGTIAVMAGDPLLVDLGNRQGIVVVIMVRRTCGLYTGFL